MPEMKRCNFTGKLLPIEEFVYFEREWGECHKVRNIKCRIANNKKRNQELVARDMALLDKLRRPDYYTNPYKKKKKKKVYDLTRKHKHPQAYIFQIAAQYREAGLTYTAKK